ncbi:MAG TPA: 2-oxoacid:acceptor oxidoreductase family protein [Chloroflexota bacterium]|nr:2-oxoacid:acceptor oxidoreductase family protein [Chloroflexota bacterium]
MTVQNGARGRQAIAEGASVGQTDEVVVSGFGGQGVLFAGQVLAHAALATGKEVTWLPSYGPEMRGGTAHCTVVIADEPIGSPVAERPRYVLALNRPSVDRFTPLVRAGGIFFFNASLVPQPPDRGDIRVVDVPATQIATALGNPLAANMVMLGALLGATRLLPLDQVIAALREHLPARHHDLLDVNEAALRRGVAGTHIQNEG